MVKIGDEMHQGELRRTAEDIRVGDVMGRPPPTVREDESLNMAWELLCRTGLHHLPVIDEEGRCRAVLNSTEIAVACARDPLARTAVRTLLVWRRTARCHPTDSVGTAAATMTADGVGALPVTDPAGRFVSLLTAHDLVAALAGRRGTRRRPPDTNAAPVVALPHRRHVT